jgi:uncharacterized membrane protein YhaH (DUF805 family)
MAKTKFVSIGDAFNNYFKNYFVVEGTATRAEYWWIVLINAIISFVPLVNFVWAIATIIPTITLTVRRMHDIGKSGGTYYLTGLGAIIAAMFAGALIGTDNPAAIILGAAFIFAAFAGMIMLFVWVLTPSLHENNPYRKKPHNKKA